MPAGFHRLIAAQFCSALADNALLIVTLAWLAQHGMAPWLAPMLKFGFTLSYVLLGPWVGPLADAGSKARLMAWMNGLKMLGATSLLMGLHPVAGFALVGLGAAAYAPAKYGLVTELVAPRQLVAANGWIEVSVVSAVLLGTGLGGALVSGPWRAFVAEGVQVLSVGAGGAEGLALLSLQAAVLVLLFVYALAGVLNLGVPDSGARYRRTPPRRMIRRFGLDVCRLWRDRQGGALSLAATTLFWGVGATLQFIVLRWAVERLALPLSQAALLQATVAVGVVLGAALAGRAVPLAAAHRMLPMGVLLGLALPVLAQVETLLLALPLLCAAGVAGGLMVVPLNALLQHRGCQLLTAGRSIAVQGFNENLSILLMLGAYAASVQAGWSIKPMMSGFGILVSVLMVLLWWMGPPPAAPVHQRSASGRSPP